MATASSSAELSDQAARALSCKPQHTGLHHLYIASSLITTLSTSSYRHTSRAAQQGYSQSNGAAMVSRLSPAFLCARRFPLFGRSDRNAEKGRTDLLMILSRRERRELVLEDCLLPPRGCAKNSSSLLPVTPHTATGCRASWLAM